MLACALATSVPLYSQERQLPPDSVLFEIASVVVRGTSATQDVWKGEWFRGNFAVLIGDGRTLAVLADGEEVPEPILARRPIEGFARTAYLLPDGYPGVPERHGNVGRIANRSLALAWPFYESVFGINDPVLTNAVVLYHEFFHVFQFGRGTWSVAGWENEPPYEVISSEGFQALAARERSLLAEALVTSSSDSLGLLLEEYLRLRSERMEMLPRGSRAYETDYERIEGTAHFVGYSAGLLAVHGSTDALVETVRFDLLNTPPFDQPLWRSGPYRDWHLYATGSAIAILLDRIAPSTSWKDPLARNTPFPELLRDALSLSAAGSSP